MKKIITFIVCFLTLSSVYGEQIGNITKKSMTKTKVKIISGYVLIMVSFVTCTDAYSNIKNYIFSYDDTYTYARFNFNKTIDQFLTSFQYRHRNIAKFMFGPGNMLLGVATFIIGHELLLDGCLSLEEIRRYERLHQ